MNFFLLCPCSRSLELVTEHVSTIARPVRCRGGVHREGDSSKTDTVCSWVKWHLSWASSIGVVLGGDVSKTKKGQALMSVSVSKTQRKEPGIGALKGQP